MAPRGAASSAVATACRPRNAAARRGIESSEEGLMARILTLITALVELAGRIGTALRWLSPTIARLTVGLVFFQSGWGKLNDLETVTNYFTELGLPNPAFQAKLASSAEFVCGGLLLLGLATRFAVVPL